MCRRQRKRPKPKLYDLISVAIYGLSSLARVAFVFDSSQREDACDDNYQRAVVLWSFVQHFAER